MNLEDKNKEIDYYIDNYPDNAIVLKRIKNKINQLQKQLEEQYSLVFMAEKGAGKTTTIDFLLGLTQEKQKINEKTKKRYIVEEDILETGSGATTTSEVEICQSDEEVSKIVITPYEIEEVKEILSVFAKSMFSNIHGTNATDEQLAPELIRACRNMTGLTEKKNEDGQKVDLLKELILQYSINEYDNFEKRIIENAKLDERKETVFICDDKNEKSWIKKVFRRLNLVHIKEAPLPKKITVMLSKNIFDFSKFNRISKIIDTRGLEVTSNTDRSDIKSIFRDGENNILLFVDKFNSPSKSIIDLVEHYIYDDGMDIVNRVGYIVNHRDGEAEKVVGCDGIIDNEKEGIEEKRNQVMQIFKDNNVYIKEKNIIYCCPKRHLDEEGKIKISADELEEYDYDKLAIEEDKKEGRQIEHDLFVNNIISFIEDYEEKLESDLEEALNSYESIKREIEKDATLDVASVVEYINNEQIDINLKDKILKMYEMYIGNKFPSTLRAINNRFGIYNSYDIYCEGANVIESLIKRTFKEFKDDIVTQLELSAKGKKLNNNQEKEKEFIVKDINKYFFNYMEEINNYFYNKLKEETFSRENDVFWEKVKSRWGKGCGYRIDIINFYENNIKDKGLSNEINENIKEMIKGFKLGIIDVLNNIENN